jgi:large subunit ribosomal protein L3
MTESGLVGTKVGMTRVFTEEGHSIPVTVLKVEPNRVVSRRETANGAIVITLAYGAEKPLAKMAKALAGQYRAADISGSEGMCSFQVSSGASCAELKVKDTLTVAQFSADQLVDVAATSKGKGFQGVIKRHNFSMQPATHGTSLSHRAHGSTGQCQDPGKVFKGKKMAGQMGNKRVTQQNLRVVRVDEANNLLLVKGAIPGAPGATVEVTAAIKQKQEGES